jgi:hypothetical protein
VATVYLDGQNLTREELSMGRDFTQLRMHLEGRLGLDAAGRKARARNPDVPNTLQPWRMFTPQGRPVVGMGDLASGPNDVVIMEGGGCPAVNVIWSVLGGEGEWLCDLVMTEGMRRRWC